MVRKPCARVSSDHGASSARDTRPDVGALLRDRARDGGALHVTLHVHDDASIVCGQDSRGSAAERSAQVIEQSVQRLRRVGAGTRAPSKYKKVPSCRLHVLRWRTTMAGITARGGDQPTRERGIGCMV